MHVRSLVLALSSLAALAPSQSPSPTPSTGASPRSTASAITPLPGTAVPRTLHVDTAADGTVWVRGSDWKAAFDARGMQFVPFLGSTAPRNFPLGLHLAGADAGGIALGVELHHAPRATDTRVEIPRGAFVEAYHLAMDSVEQTFVFGRPVHPGALRVRMQVDTELAAAGDGDGGFRFANERGGVHYGKAVAVDAAGRSIAVASDCDGASLVLTVPADFVAAATFPLTIDPIVSTFGLLPGPNTLDESNADCAYVGTFNGLYASAHEEHYSQTDHDVLVVARDRDGNVMTSAYADYTTDYWATPAIASHRGASQFLVVASKGAPAAVGRTIWGRTLTWNGVATLTMSGQFPIQSFGNGMNPDVGGNANPSPSAPTGYCVTWTGTIDGELYYNLVRTDTSLQATNGMWLDPGQEFISNPTISKSCGIGAFQSQEWLIVWQKRYSPTDEDIHGSRIGVDGAVRTLDFLIDYSSLSDTNPEVSSLTDTSGAGVEQFAVVYQREFPGSLLSPAHSDIMGQLFTTTTPVSGTVNLTGLLGGSIFDNHYDPCIDTDGQRFALGFTQWPSIFSLDTEPYLATLHVVNNTFEVTALPELCNAYHGHDEQMHITSERSGGSFTPRYMAAWHTEHTPNPPSGAGTLGAFYYGHIALGPTSYFNISLPGCGSLTLTPSGLPALAQVFQLDLTGAQGIPFLLFGNWLVNPVNVCPACILGVDSTTAIVLQTTSVSVFVPPNVNLLGLQVGAQGLDLFAPGACTVPLDFALSNMLLITVL